MTVCLNCGQTITTISRECPHCHAPITVGGISNAELVNKQKIDYDCNDSKITLLSAICFPYGIYYYIKNKDDLPLKARSALGGVMIAIIILAIIITLLLFINIMK